jgi:hypothetical protein
MRPTILCTAEAAAGAVVDEVGVSEDGFEDEAAAVDCLADEEEGGVVFEEFHRDRTKGERATEEADGCLTDSTRVRIVEAAGLADSSKRELAVDRLRLLLMVPCTCTFPKAKAARLLQLAAQRGPRGMRLILEGAQQRGGAEREKEEATS